MAQQVATNITWHAGTVSREERQASMGQQGATLWMTGLSASGKSTIAGALASYERTLISPPTRFDAWVAGRADALTEAEVRGLELFAGKGRCIACHAGFAFTDHNFYDIGLPGADRGRGKQIGLPAADYAFKTPTLRELTWTAPYMHDGSLATLEDVVRHYETQLGFDFTLAEEADLVAFMKAL